MGIRPAEEWAGAQRSLRERYESGADVPRRPVHIRWQEGAETSAGTGRPPAGTGVEIVVTTIDRPPETMRFEATSDLHPPARRGRTDALLVGEIGAHAAAGVEVPGGVVWAARAPVESSGPAGRAPRVERGSWQPAGVSRPRTGRRVRRRDLVFVVLVALALVIVSVGRWAHREGWPGAWSGPLPLVVSGVLMVSSWFAIGWDSRRRPGPGQPGPGGAG